ncbi:MAG TPA: hypothetical protein VLL52_08625, partial [Anaerolineae bacterium]|nr:hypothetical protein [Anaerolineae bacterium]
MTEQSNPEPIETPSDDQSLSESPQADENSLPSPATDIANNATPPDESASTPPTDSTEPSIVAHDTNTDIDTSPPASVDTPDEDDEEDMPSTIISPVEEPPPIPFHHLSSSA